MRGHRNTFNTRLHWAHWLVIVLSLLLTFVAWFFSYKQVNDKKTYQFAQKAKQVVSLIQERLEKYEDALLAGRAYVEITGQDLNRKTWAQYSEKLNIYKRYPGINGIGIIYAFSADQLPVQEKKFQKEYPGFKVYPKHARTESMPIVYVEPVLLNKQAVGLDMAHEKNRYTAAVKARETGRPQITGPITLVQDQEKTPGFLFYVPFYQMQNNQRTFVGLVYAPFIVKNLVHGILAEKNRQVAISISDAGVNLYSEVQKEGTYHPQYSMIITKNIYGREWQFHVWSTPAFDSMTQNAQPFYILFGGILIDVLLFIIFFLMARYNKNANLLVQEATRKLELKTEMLDRLACYDALTNLPNRESLREKMQTLIDDAVASFALCIIKFVNIRQINDVFGYDVGDSLLVKASKILLHKAGKTVFLSRVSNNEFAFIFESISASAKLKSTVKTILHAFDKPISIKKNKLKLNYHAGIAFYPESASGVEVLIKNADIAMSSAKQSGKDNVKIYDANLNQSLTRQYTLITELHSALSREQFSLNYQPQVDLRTGEIIGIEALIRWHHPDLGDISPAEFIPLAEENGTIVHIGRWVIEKALSDLKKLKKQFPSRHLILSVNASPVELLSRDYLHYLETQIKNYGILPEMLLIELTETAVIQNIQTISKKLLALKALSVGIALDDFGTGYSSMEYIRDLPMSLIKIDKGFVQDIKNKNSQVIIQSVIQIAHKLNIKVLAEGVETIKQYEYLVQHDCDEAQGYYLYRPMSYSQLVKVIHRHKTQ